MKSRFGLGLNLVAEWPEASITLLSSFFYGVCSPKRNREAALRATDFTKELGGGAGVSMNFVHKNGSEQWEL